jgi:hypothetical protein
LDLLSADLRRKPAAPRGGYKPATYRQPTQPVKAAGHAQPSKPNPAKAILDKAIAAKGGLTRLRSIRTVRAETTTTVHGKTGTATVTFPSTTWIEYPDHFRVDADMPGGKVTQVYADGHYWVQDANGIKEMQEPGLAQMQSAVERDMIRMLVKAGSGDLVVREIDSDDPQLAAIEFSGGGMAPVSCYVNRNNGLIEKARYSSGVEGRAEELYSDYRDVKGVQFAFHTVLRRGSLPEIERDVRTIHYNVPLPQGLFVKPS